MERICARLFVISRSSTSSARDLARARRRGTVYERVSGRTISIKEPTRLAQLFGRGDQARKEAQAKAHSAARAMLLIGRDLKRYEPERPQFGLGLAAPGYLSEISSRLFSREFEECVHTTIDAVDHGPRMPAGEPVLNAEVSQDARLFISEGREDVLGWSWAVRATWHGAVGVYWVPGVTVSAIPLKGFPAMRFVRGRT